VSRVSRWSKIADFLLGIGFIATGVIPNRTKKARRYLEKAAEIKETAEDVEKLVKPQKQAVIFCSNCGSAWLPDAKFCGKCGKRLQSGLQRSVTKKRDAE